ncbi:hypothetical protein SacmaDRAFT_5742 [Saccharomonospora marina XMU15]|uniref:Uncharacterized protein n=1 Tax=Saccharomonospora marina XMU15 TaxID=882083 RepID=H5XC52_9PSEU|nr:hypothetical protein [Saccharomonospora marina]EHR53856.1 hypothetical protein SacmaDRAFT_5742 [Saccharomonospora marina XMU15]
MRIRPPALARTMRKALTTTAVAAAVGGLTVLSGGTAAATTLVTDTCTSAVAGQIGDQIAIPGTSVKDLVRQGAIEAKTVIIVHDLTIWPDHLANQVAKKQLTVGTVPDARTATISGQAIGAAVKKALEGSAGLGILPATQQTTLDTIAKKVAGSCGLTLSATNYSAPSQPGRQSPGGQQGSAPSSGYATPGTQGYAAGGNGSLQGTGDTRAARRDYGGIPAVSAPSAGISVPPNLRYPPSSGVPGQPNSPEFGILGAEQGQGGQPDDVRNAGNAAALAASDSADQVQLPMLLAVVALAGVTAGLVRTWVLRRVS